MKKLLLVLLAVFALSGTAYAEDMEKVVYMDLPTTLFVPPDAGISTFSIPTSEEALYASIESTILDACRMNNVMESDIIIDLSGLDILEDDLTIDFSDGKISFQELCDIFVNVVINNPEIGNLNTAFAYKLYSYESAPDTYYIYQILPLYRKPYSEAGYNEAVDKEDYLLKSHNQEKYEEAINYAFSKAVAPDMTEDWEKFLGIHNYLVNSAYYDPNHADSSLDEETIDALDDSLVHTPYSALVGDQKTVCQGYSLAFKLLCDMAGLDCGYALAPGHIWNVVNIDGVFYHIDITWDDPASFRVSDGINVYLCPDQHVTYDHFLQSAADGEATHSYLGDISVSMADYPTRDTDKQNDNYQFPALLDSYIYPMYWEDGNFWGQKQNHYLNNAASSVYHALVNSYFKLEKNLSVSTVSKDQYLLVFPDKLDSKIYYPKSLDDNSDYIAVDGAPNTTAKLYSAEYSGKRLTRVSIADIAFDDKGKAVATVPEWADKLMLFADNSATPLAHYR